MSFRDKSGTLIVSAKLQKLIYYVVHKTFSAVRPFVYIFV